MTTPYLPVLSPLMVEEQVRAALSEDLGRAGDITSQATIAPEMTATAELNAREDGVVAGLDLARAAFRLMDPAIRFEAFVKDGDRLAPGTVIAKVSGPARAVLSAERVALNFLMHLCGVATHTARFSGEIAHTPAKVCCTRKTIPGLRALEKYAVRMGAAPRIATGSTMQSSSRTTTSPLPAASRAPSAPRAPLPDTSSRSRWR